MSMTRVKQALTATLIAATMGGAMITMPSTAEARGGRNAAIAAGAVGAIALGAAAAAAANNRGPDRVYVEERESDCYWQRQRVWDGYGYRVQRVQVCE